MFASDNQFDWDRGSYFYEKGGAVKVTIYDITVLKVKETHKDATLIEVLKCLKID